MQSPPEQTGPVETEQQQIMVNLQKKIDELQSIAHILTVNNFPDYSKAQNEWVMGLQTMGYIPQNYDKFDELFQNFNFQHDETDRRNIAFRNAFQAFRRAYSLDTKVKKYFDTIETKKFFCLLSLAFYSINVRKNHDLSRNVHQLIIMQIQNLNEEMNNTLDSHPPVTAPEAETSISSTDLDKQHQQEEEKNENENENDATPPQKEEQTTPTRIQQSPRVGTYPQYTISRTTTLLLLSSLGLSLLSIMQTMSPKFTLLLLGVHLPPILLLSLALATAAYGFYRMRSENQPRPADNASPPSFYQRTLNLFGLSQTPPPSQTATSSHRDPRIR